MELLKHLHDEDRITIVMVSHLLNVVANYAKKLALIDGASDWWADRRGAVTRAPFRDL